MKKVLSILVLALIIVPSIFVFSACGKNDNKNKFEIGYWETQKVNHVYTVDELASLTIEQLTALKNSYIKLECVVEDIFILENLYYQNILESNKLLNDGTSFTIYAGSYQNYWEIPFEKGDEVYVEGYVYSALSGTDYLSTRYITLRIHPCIITAK